MRNLNIFILIIAFTLTIFSGCSSDSKSPKTSSNEAVAQTAPSSQPRFDDKTGLIVEADAPEAPPWTMKGIDGKNYSLDQFQGKVIIIDFWDTWCPPCIKGIPDLIELYDEYEKEGLVVVGAAMGREGEAKVKSFASSKGMDYPVTIATPQVIGAHGGIRSIPTAFVIDKKGRLRAMHVGLKPKSTYDIQVKALLAEK